MVRGKSGKFNFSYVAKLSKAQPPAVLSLNLILSFSQQPRHPPTQPGKSCLAKLSVGLDFRMLTDFFQTFAHNYCSQLWFTTLVHNFGSQLWFTTIVPNFGS